MNRKLSFLNNKETNVRHPLLAFRVPCYTGCQSFRLHDRNRFTHTIWVDSPTLKSIRLHLSRKNFVKIDEHLCLYGGEQRVYLARFFSS